MPKNKQEMHGNLLPLLRYASVQTMQYPQFLWSQEISGSLWLPDIIFDPRPRDNVHPALPKVSFEVGNLILGTLLLVPGTPFLNLCQTIHPFTPLYLALSLIKFCLQYCSSLHTYKDVSPIE